MRGSLDPVGRATTLTTPIHDILFSPDSQIAAVCSNRKKDALRMVTLACSGTVCCVTSAYRCTFPRLRPSPTGQPVKRLFMLCLQWHLVPTGDILQWEIVAGECSCTDLNITPEFESSFRID